MKNLILILTLCIMSKVSFAKTVNASIDGDLEFKFETEYSQTKRVVASEDEDQKVSAQDSEQSKRDVASDEEVFDKTNERGVRFWKYDSFDSKD